MAEVFSPKTVKFLKDIERRNNREWYAANKKVYQEHVLQPFKHLVAQLSGPATDIDPYIETTPAIDKTISRIYRDTRFSNDKRPYRGNVWVVLRRRGDSLFHFPAFFFEVYPTYFHYGMGFYQSTARYMQHYRAAISEDEKTFLKIISAIKRKGVFSLEGEEYKKNRYPGKQAQLATWYNRKHLFLIAREDDVSLIYDFAGLIKRLEKGFASLSGLYHFLLKVHERVGEHDSVLLPDNRW